MVEDVLALDRTNRLVEGGARGVSTRSGTRTYESVPYVFGGPERTSSARSRPGARQDPGRCAVPHPPRPGRALVPPAVRSREPARPRQLPLLRARSSSPRRWSWASSARRPCWRRVRSGRENRPRRGTLPAGPGQQGPYRRAIRALDCGAACRNRTDDLRITSALLWPTELRRRGVECRRAAPARRTDRARGTSPAHPPLTRHVSAVGAIVVVAVLVVATAVGPRDAFPGRTGPDRDHGRGVRLGTRGRHPEPRRPRPAPAALLPDLHAVPPDRRAARPSSPSTGPALRHVEIDVADDPGRRPHAARHADADDDRVRPRRPGAAPGLGRPPSGGAARGAGHRADRPPMIVGVLTRRRAVDHGRLAADLCPGR